MTANAAEAEDNYLLAGRYLKGEGVERDTQQAVRLFIRAAEGGNPKAQYNLSVMFRAGIGVARDPVCARLWLERAAVNGHSQAIRSLQAEANVPAVPLLVEQLVPVDLAARPPAEPQAATR